MSDEQPLVWTSKGNLPISVLEYFTEWEDTTDQVRFIEGYKLGEEIVKRSVHVMIKQGLAVFGEQGTFNG